MFQQVLTRGEAGFHGELEAAPFKAAAERWDVLLLPKGVGLRKHGFYLGHVAFLKPPVWETKMSTKT